MSNCHTLRLFYSEFDRAKVASMPTAGRSFCISLTRYLGNLALAVGLCCRSQVCWLFIFQSPIVSHTGYYGSWRKRHNFVIYES